jgi:hypothetical protein
MNCRGVPARPGTTAQVDVHNMIELIQGDVGQRRQDAGESRIHVVQVDPAEPADRVGDAALHFGFGRYVGLNPEAVARQLGGHGLLAVAVDIDSHHARALDGQTPRGRTTEANSRTGHHSHLAAGERTICHAVSCLLPTGCS